MSPASTNLWVEHLKGSACRRTVMGKTVSSWAAAFIVGLLERLQNVGQQRQRRQPTIRPRTHREHINDERDVDRATPHRDVRSDSQVIGPCRADSLEAAHAPGA
jgi:hypothetical protein